MEQEQQIRYEEDSIGKKAIPKDAFYGVQTLRAHENFNMTGLTLHPVFIKAMAWMKQAAAITNFRVGRLSKEKQDAIVKACTEIIDGKYHEAFIVDPIQGGAGTSMNMNANEVIANIALVELGNEKGQYTKLHPLDDVNDAQSTNDIIPSSGKLATILLLDDLLLELERLYQSLVLKGEEFYPVLKMGRTQLQDALPIRLGQEFNAYARVVKREKQRIERARDELYELNLGGTAIGTGLNADEQYVKQVVNVLSELTNRPFVQAEDLIDATQNLDGFLSVSHALKGLATSISKIANDLRLMSSDPKTGLGEIVLPAKQNGSSIMPGKINPVIPEVINQVAFRTIGNDMTITMAVEAGQLELNAFEPVIFYSLFESIQLLTNGISTFIDNCIVGIEANVDHCRHLVEHSVAIVTALSPHIGYQEAANLAKAALKANVPIRQLALERQLLTKEELDEVLDPDNMTHSGIVGKGHIHVDK